jgi:hypothetical protein
MRLTIAIAILICGAIQFARAADDKKPDALQAKTVWQGVSDADPRWANRKEVPARLRITQRDGENFTAQIAFLKPGDIHAARLEGKIRNGELVAHITKIIKGEWGADAVENIWKGNLDGDNLLLQRTNKKNMTATCKLKLDHHARGSEADDVEEKRQK